MEGRLRDPAATRLSVSEYGRRKDTTGCFGGSFKAPVEGYEAILATPFENRHLLNKVPDFYERLKRSYDARFFGQEALGST